MLSLCSYCERKVRCKKLANLYTAMVREQNNSPHYDIEIDIMVKSCNKFKKIPNRAIELVHICFSCKNKNECELWEQVSWIDEDFVKEKFELNPGEQSVGIAVNYCKLYKP